VRLPFADQALVPQAKITEYLLNEHHPQGGAKARFFIRVGFRRHEADRFEQALLELAQTSEMQESRSQFGRKYVGLGLLLTPNGERLPVVTVWMLREGQPPPTLVSAYPA
jgi:hypothetical protein